MPNAVVKAKIFELDASGNAKDQNGIDVCFNPKEYSLEKGADWGSAKSKNDAPVPEFKQPKAMTLSVTLQFDTYEERVSVRDKYIRKIERLLFMASQDVKSEKDVKKHAPPQIRFVWGKMQFRGVIESL